MRQSMTNKLLLRARSILEDKSEAKHLWQTRKMVFWEEENEIQSNAYVL